jgi:predicted esterase YcpF (UPF0227 family)
MLYYIHGYQSNPQSTKGILFKKRLGAIPIHYRDCVPEDIKISDCLLRIEEYIKDDKNAILIGSSLGGFLAAKIAQNHTNVNQIVLLNPAIIPPTVDISSIKDIPRTILEDMADLTLFEKKIPATIFIFRGIEDKVVPDNWVITFAAYQEATIRFFKDDHRFSKNVKILPKLILQNISLS